MADNHFLTQVPYCKILKLFQSHLVIDRHNQFYDVVHKYQILFQLPLSNILEHRYIFQNLEEHFLNYYFHQSIQN